MLRTLFCSLIQSKGLLTKILIVITCDEKNIQQFSWFFLIFLHCTILNYLADWAYLPMSSYFQTEANFIIVTPIYTNPIDNADDDHILLHDYATSKRLTSH